MLILDRMSRRARRTAPGSSVRLVCAALLVIGCGGARAQRAVIVPAARRALASTTPAPSTRALEIRPTARTYVVDPSRSRFELYASDVITGEHKGTFGSWSARIEISERPRILAHVETASIQVDMAGATGIVKRFLLETDRYPAATLDATLSRTDGPPEEHVVEGTAVLHGIAKGIRFTGTLEAEGEGFRFRTTFVVSRKDFEIRYTPIEPLMRDDVRIVLDAFARPLGDLPAPMETASPPVEAPAPVPSTWFTSPR